MLRRLIAGLLAGCLAHAALLTDYLGTAKRVRLEQTPIAERAVWEEYGLLASETARYESEGGAKPFTATAWQMRDPTGAQAAFRWLRPEGAGPGGSEALKYTNFAAAYKDTLLMTYGSYLLRFEGRAPSLKELQVLLFQLPAVDQSALPPLLNYLPQKGLIPGTDRYILGPASLEKFLPQISPSTAGFHFGAEAHVGRYRGPTGKVEEMAVFYYPTNSMARDREAEFRKVAGALVKRSGPLIALVAAPKDPDEAERLLAMVNYRATVTLNEPRPGAQAQSAGDLLISIFLLTGLLLALCVAAGILVFGMRALRRKLAGGVEEDPMTMLHLEDRR